MISLSSVFGHPLDPGGLLSWRRIFTSSEGQEEREGHLGSAPRSGWALTGQPNKTWKKAKADPRVLRIHI